jgi:hypothetical protein
VLQAEVDTLLEEQRTSVLAKARQLEDNAFSLGSAPQICAAIRVLYDRPLIRELMGRRGIGREEDMVARELMLENASRMLDTLKTRGSRRKEDDNVTRAILTAFCGGSKMVEQGLRIHAVAKETRMRWHLVKQCQVLREGFDKESTDGTHRGWKVVPRGTYSNKLDLGDVIDW